MEDMSTVTDWEDELECDIETSESGEIKIENSPGQVYYSTKIHYIAMEIYF